MDVGANPRLAKNCCAFVGEFFFFGGGSGKKVGNMLRKMMGKCAKHVTCVIFR